MRTIRNSRFLGIFAGFFLVMVVGWTAMARGGSALLNGAIWAQVPPPPPKSKKSSSQRKNPPAPPAAQRPRVPTPTGPILNDNDPRVKAAVGKAARFLLTQGSRERMVGELSLAIHALAKIHEKYPEFVSETDPVFVGMVNKLRSACAGGFKPSRRGGADNYESGCAAMALAAAGGEAFKDEISEIANYILQKQQDQGAWSYDGQKNGDCSMTQYGILGLWEAAASAGVHVPYEAWDRAAKYLVAHQEQDGGWDYHPGKGGGHSLHTMTVAGLGSVYICRDHLPGGKRKSSRGFIIKKVTDAPEQNRRYVPTTTAAEIDGSLQRASEWLEKHFTVNNPSAHGSDGSEGFAYYYLYALERYGTLAGIKTIGGKDWYSSGASFIVSKQNDNGSWNGRYGQTVDSSFAVLFLVRSTHVSLRIHRRRLGRGTLFSAKGLPTDLRKLAQTRKGLRSDGIRGNTGDLLKILETGTLAQREGAIEGLLQKMYDKEWKGTDLNKWKKMTESPDPVERAAGVKLLAHSSDYGVIPLLINSLYDEDEKVQLAALNGLCKISRKFDGFGWYAQPTNKKWVEEIVQWKKWYYSVRPDAELVDEVVIREDPVIEEAGPAPKKRADAEQE